ncbi:hypothetical protein IMZ48_34955 [Candidatus Bathyarchaeota archaeon]|nr:hypothetical protein [Candidatus Bathyarchaeota archaeon]
MGPAPYDVSAERMPDHRVFSIEFQDMLQRGMGIARGTVAAIDRLTAVVGDDDTLADLRKDALRLSSFRATDTKTIAVLGDSGEGRFLVLLD